MKRNKSLLSQFCKKPHPSTIQEGLTRSLRKQRSSSPKIIEVTVISRKPLQEKGKINDVNLGTRFTTVIKPCTHCNQSSQPEK